MSHTAHRTRPPLAGNKVFVITRQQNTRQAVQHIFIS